MNIYIICPVRLADPLRIASFREYAKQKRDEGHSVHFPPDDVNQSDPTGLAICDSHRTAMYWADEVHIFWDVDSKGSHFDLGMAFALEKRLVPVAHIQDDGESKSYWKVINAVYSAHAA